MLYKFLFRHTDRMHGPIARGPTAQDRPYMGLVKELIELWVQLYVMAVQRVEISFKLTVTIIIQYVSL